MQSVLERKPSFVPNELPAVTKAAIDRITVSTKRGIFTAGWISYWSLIAIFVTAESLRDLLMGIARIIQGTKTLCAAVEPPSRGGLLPQAVR
ncbi:hypothetical protein A9513_001145 [Pseudomonas sp. AU12215]|nr:hypothetical protein A9513_001145 [Pseudomonas sp. AU12215]